MRCVWLSMGFSTMRCLNIVFLEGSMDKGGLVVRCLGAG